MSEIAVLSVCIVTGKKLAGRTWILRDKEILQDLGFNVRIHGIDSDVPSLNFMRNIKSYIEALRNCDIVIAWFAFPSTILLSKIMGLPVIANAVGYEVAHYPEMEYGLPQVLIARPLITLALKYSDDVIAISRESLRWSYRWSRRKGFIIYEGIDFGRYDCNIVGGRILPEEPTILTISALSILNTIRKDIPTLIKAVKEVTKKYPSIKAYIIGEKMDGYPLLKQMTQKLHINNNVIFTGKLSHEELLRLLCKADLFVMTSYQEGFPTVACEASVAGIPVIVSNRPAMNEVFTDETAIIVKPRNPSELANAIIYALENKEEALKKARKAQMIIKREYSTYVRKEKMRRFMRLFIKRLKNNTKSYYKYSIKHIALLLILLVIWWPLYIINIGIIKFKQEQLLRRML